MMRVIKGLGLAVLYLTLVFASPPPVAMACSGGSPRPLSYLLEEPTTIVVKARVLDADSYGQTAVIEVLEYLGGKPDADLLLVVQTPPAHATSWLSNRHGSGGCSTLGAALKPNEVVYLFLLKNDDSTYRNSVQTTSLSGRSSYRFPEPTSTQFVTIGEVGTAETPSTTEEIEVNEQAFREIVLDYTQSIPSAPTREVLYPMPAPILLRTTAGYYLLAPDHSTPQSLSDDEVALMRRSPAVWRKNDPLGVTACNVVGCVAFSPNGVDSGTLNADGIILNGLPITGEGFMFSPFNEAIAVWNGENIDFYTFRYPRLGLEEFHNHFLASQLTNRGGDWVGQAAWSRDGRLFAYTDADGLWLLDVYSQTQRLLLPTESGQQPPTARYFSAGGRYLAITLSGAGERHNLDLVTGSLLPDGVISPNERFLIAYDTATDISPYSRCILTGIEPGCREEGLSRETLWLGDEFHLTSRCGSTDAVSCDVHMLALYCCSASFGPTISFDYEPVTGVYLTTPDAYSIKVWDRPRSPQRDLTGQIDGEIITAEWLPSLYLSERTFSEVVFNRDFLPQQAAPIP